MKTKVYDKAKYHFEADNFPEDLDEKQAYVHTGFYYGWLANNDFFKDSFVADFGQDIQEFKDGKITAPELFMRVDGVLVSDDLTDEGNDFTYAYFDFNRGAYLRDYEALYDAKKLTWIPIEDEGFCLYQIEDSKENFSAVSGMLDKQYAYWKQRQNSLFNRLYRYFKR
jgi:hypothetical protein